MADTLETAKQTAQPERPEWIDETPDVVHYQLAVFDDDHEWQGIEVSRAEFITLKAQLAQMRGFQIAPAPERPTEAAPDRFASFQHRVNDSLRDYFEGFLKEGTPGDKHFLWDVLSSWLNTRLLDGDGYLVRAAAEDMDVEQPAA